jgi:hypothetical protein
MTAYTVTEVDSSIRNLDDLLDVICGLHFEPDAGVRDHRVDSLLWIARDLSAGIVAARNIEAADAIARTGEASHV